MLSAALFDVISLISCKKCKKSKIIYLYLNNISSRLYGEWCSLPFWKTQPRLVRGDSRKFSWTKQWISEAYSSVATFGFVFWAKYCEGNLFVSFCSRSVCDVFIFVWWGCSSLEHISSVMEFVCYVCSDFPFSKEALPMGLPSQAVALLWSIRV